MCQYGLLAYVGALYVLGKLRYFLSVEDTSTHVDNYYYNDVGQH